MKITIDVTPPELDLILSGLHDIERTGWYYGRKDQFDNRLQKLILKLNQILSEIEKAGKAKVKK